MTQKPSVWLEFSPLAQATGSINLGQGFPDWAPPEFIQEAAAEAVRGNGFSSYARSPGHLPLVRAIASQYGKTLSMDISAEKQVLVTVGASEALYLALSTFVSRGDEVIVIEPAFDLYFGCLDWIGATVRSVPLVSDGEGSPSSSGEFQIDWQQLKTSLSPKTKAILINTPHNPTGKVLSQDEIEQLALHLRDYPDCMVISDEVYEPLVYDQKTHIPLASVEELRQKTLSIYSAGKMFSVTGWKIGWVIGPEELIFKMQMNQQWVVFSVATPLQQAVAEALTAALSPYQGFADYYSWLRQHYQDKRAHLMNSLKQAGLNPVAPEGSFFILSHCQDFDESFRKLPAGLETLYSEHGILYDDSKHHEIDYNVARNLSLAQRVTAIPVSAFVRGRNPGQGDWVRFAFCKSQDQLDEARVRLSQLRSS